MALYRVLVRGTCLFPTEKRFTCKSFKDCRRQRTVSTAFETYLERLFVLVLWRILFSILAWFPRPETLGKRPVLMGRGWLVTRFTFALT